HYYLGLIGSRNKVKRIKEDFVNEGIASSEEVENVDMPIGLDINAESADEIAISIIAKLIKEKNTAR
ncbi:MAG: XdhC family protein, partial [Bacteroidota bacterium]